MFNNLCIELNRWQKYVKENKGDKKDACQLALILTKIFNYLFFPQKNNPQKPQTRVKKPIEDMQATLVNRRKTTAKFPKSVLKRNNKVEEGGTSRLEVKKSRRTQKHGPKR